MHQTIQLLFQPFIGLAGAPVIDQFVEFLKKQFRLPTPLAPITAVISAILFNVGAAAYLHQSIMDGFIIGIFSGFLACGWYAATK